MLHSSAASIFVLCTERVLHSRARTFNWKKLFCLQAGKIRKLFTPQNCSSTHRIPFCEWCSQTHTQKTWTAHSRRLHRNFIRKFSPFKNVNATEVFSRYCKIHIIKFVGIRHVRYVGCRSAAGYEIRFYSLLSGGSRSDSSSSNSNKRGSSGSWGGGLSVLLDVCVLLARRTRQSLAITAASPDAVWLYQPGRQKKTHSQSKHPIRPGAFTHCL